VIARLEVLGRRIARFFVRSEWFVRLLGLSQSEGTETAPGLVMIQIDGLSHTQLERALKSRMPFLKRLLHREHYRLQQLYSGVPSTTPAVQAELFYGVRNAVPAFSFYHPPSERIVRMYEPSAVAAIEPTIAQRGEQPLLAEGSAYADVYEGGANEAHFCPTSLGWGPPLRDGKRWATIMLIASNAYSFLRTLALFVLELVLAIVDCVRGIIARRDLIKELKFVPTRVAISILLRELTVIGAKIDIARGLPIVHLNLLGYDEQAHRRGPSSAFAHWTLSGIDDAVARLWRAALGATRRHYDVWIYADHGQEAVIPYSHRFGVSLDEAVKASFAAVLQAEHEPAKDGDHGTRHQRAGWLGGKRLQRLFRVDQADGHAEKTTGPTVVALGPVGLVYPEHPLSERERNDIAKSLTANASIPMVLLAEGTDHALAYTEDGRYRLPDDAASILGADHPFRDDAALDLTTLCHHADAGALVLCGWRHSVEPLSFAIENGAHCGAGPEETNGFVLTPTDSPLKTDTDKPLRPLDLRQAALTALGRVEEPAKRQHVRRHAEGLRVMTYNVHACVGMDGKLAPERVARVIAQHRPDIVALQELDVGRRRSNGVDQAELIARHLDMEKVFSAALHIEEGRYGNAILTHLPMRLIKAEGLPSGPSRWPQEPRGALWVAIDVGNVEIQVMNTHFGLSPSERKAQAEALASQEWLADPACRGPVLLCGDLNALPNAPACRRLGKRLNNVGASQPTNAQRGTFFGRFPIARIDHIFFSDHFVVETFKVPSSSLTRVASDHLPLIADLQLDTASTTVTDVSKQKGLGAKPAANLQA
jgi:endonuclease/exonuclease/phosphatase family metal-dependent hydrolase